MGIQYEVVKRIVRNNRRIGFVVKNRNNEYISMLDSEIKYRMNHGEVFNIIYNNRGFAFKDKTVHIDSLLIERYSNKKSKKEIPEECKNCLRARKCMGGAKCLTYAIKNDYHKRDVNCFYF